MNQSTRKQLDDIHVANSNAYFWAFHFVALLNLGVITDEDITFEWRGFEGEGRKEFEKGLEQLGIMINKNLGLRKDY